MDEPVSFNLCIFDFIRVQVELLIDVDVEYIYIVIDSFGVSVYVNPRFTAPCFLVPIAPWLMVLFIGRIMSFTGSLYLSVEASKSSAPEQYRSVIYI